MPSGKAHDAITWLCAVPTYALMYYLTGSFRLAGCATLATLFSGLMFGPDLDIRSKQYHRWGLLRWLWLPYQKLLPHRSFFSHGIILGPAIRIIYFALVLTLLFIVFSYARASLLGGEPLMVQDVTRYRPQAENVVWWLWRQPETWAIIAGTWWGAATHSITDFIVTTWRRNT